MLYVDLLNILYKLEINRTFIEHRKNISIKKLKKCTYINMENSVKIDPLGLESMTHDGYIQIALMGKESKL